MDEIIFRYRVLSDQLSFVNSKIKTIRRNIESQGKNNYGGFQRLLSIYEDEKQLINSDIDSLAYQVPITQHF